MNAVPAFLAGAGAAAVVAGGASALSAARKRKRNRELLARIRPARKEFHDAAGHVCAVQIARADGTAVRFGMTLPQRIIAFARGDMAAKFLKSSKTLPVGMPTRYPSHVISRAGETQAVVADVIRGGRATDRAGRGLLRHDKKQRFVNGRLQTDYVPRMPQANRLHSDKAGNLVGKRFSTLTPGMISFDRARNGDGEFSPGGGEGGAGPAEMIKAYGPPQGMTSGGKAAAVAGGVGSAGAAALLLKSLRKRK